MERRPSQPQQGESETQRQQLRSIIAEARAGAYVMATGGAGLVLSEVTVDPRTLDSRGTAIYILARVISYMALVGGGYLSVNALSRFADYASQFIPTHKHPHEHELVQHTHSHGHGEITSHKHKPEDIVYPQPPSLEQQRRESAKQFIEDNKIKEEYRRILLELGLSNRAVNGLLRRAEPYNSAPLSIAGLRLFLQYERLQIELQGGGIGARTMNEIREKVALVTYPESIEDHEKLTPSERDQMVKNGFIKNS